MKTKKFNKLSLNKQTVASLNADKLNAVNGGTGYNTGIGFDKTKFCFFKTITGVKTTTGPTGSFVCYNSENCPPTSDTMCTSHKPTTTELYTDQGETLVMTGRR